jgi:superfamily II DNA/RNA helicase
MKPIDLINAKDPDAILSELAMRIHLNGPIKQEDLETLTYLKVFHPRCFQKTEKRLMYLLGLFYKTDTPEDLISFSYSIFAQAIFDESGQNFTPIQARIRNNIQEKKYFSFSAPTSAGKSFLFRELIRNQKNDIVIVVPSRALIAEYILAVRDIVGDQKNILILQFIDDVNKKRTTRRIFVVTPERASDIFKSPERFQPSLFLYDEAQISEEKTRGISFDAFVRRADRVFPAAKKVFAHPFIKNPEAQLNKHALTENSAAEVYKQSTVGKMYLGFDKTKASFECFSPFLDNAHLAPNKVAFREDIVKKKLLDGGSVLIYITKASIYSRSFEDDFKHYISLCKPISGEAALEIVAEIEELIGAKDRKSELINLMKRGVVIHHGSIPLNVRFLIEKFTNLGFARICFATSTLAQGVNMPFDIVWVENFRFEGSSEDKTLGLKNLIGRAGRNTNQTNNFDFGYVIVKDIKSFIERFNGETSLSNSSLLDESNDNIPEDLLEFITAMKENDLNDNYNLPNCKAERLNSDEAKKSILDALDFLFKDEKIIDGTSYRNLSRSAQEKLKNSLARIFELSLGRKIFSGEKAVLSASITILLWQIQGKTFKELLGLRYSYLTNQKDQRKLISQARLGTISWEDCMKQIEAMPINYSAIPHILPDADLKTTLPSRFQRKRMKDFNYDLLVYDTYDFLDKVISFSLSDVFVAAFDQFYAQTADPRAKKMVNYFRFGTNEEHEIWLMRYGFSIEEVELIKSFVNRIDENEILFSDSLLKPQNAKTLKIVERYM